MLALRSLAPLQAPWLRPATRAVRRQRPARITPTQAFFWLRQRRRQSMARATLESPRGQQRQTITTPFLFRFLTLDLLPVHRSATEETLLHPRQVASLEPADSTLAEITYTLCVPLPL